VTTPHVRALKDPVFGSHRDFAGLYETFLDAVYSPPDGVGPTQGRWRLVNQVASEIRSRDARHVLDCAAGTGFPALDLEAVASSHGIETLHYTDGDPEMIRVLRRKAGELGVTLPPLKPVPLPIGGTLTKAIDPLVLDWSDLWRIQRPYDYVMCRGNSLVYADTWSGSGAETVASPDKIINYLRKIAVKVRPGGYLHVDAPWKVELEHRALPPVEAGDVTIWEEVRTSVDHRHWRVGFKRNDSRTLKFERYSSLLTVEDLSGALDSMGFEETKPFTMPGERPNFGVIIARKSHGGSLSTCRFE
jgi:SAM-dependent methyltransferase